MIKSLFETTVINTGGRQGAVYSEDHIFYLDVAKPQALGGDATTATNPEQLFAAGYSACFNSALEMVLERDKVEVEIIGLDDERKREYVDKAHHFCPYSKAVKDSIDIEITIL